MFGWITSHHGVDVDVALASRLIALDGGGCSKNFLVLPSAEKAFLHPGYVSLTKTKFSRVGSSNFARSSAVRAFRAFQHRSVSTWSAVCCTSLKKEPFVGEPQNMHFILVPRVCSLLPQFWLMCRVRIPLFERVSWHVGIEIGAYFQREPSNS